MYRKWSSAKISRERSSVQPVIGSLISYSTNDLQTKASHTQRKNFILFYISHAHIHAQREKKRKHFLLLSKHWNNMQSLYRFFFVCLEIRCVIRINVCVISIDESSHGKTHRLILLTPTHTNTYIKFDLKRENRTHAHATNIFAAFKQNKWPFTVA